MKISISTLLLFSTLLTFVQHSNAQDNNLYLGYVGWAGSLRDKITIIDTTGGNFALAGADQITLNSDEGEVRGCYGLALHPVSSEMYILYQTVEGGNENRRLGTLNTTTGEILDIGIAGNLRDLTFVDEVLYGTTASQGDSYQLVSIDIATGSTTEVFDHLWQNEGSTITYNYYDGYIIKIDDGNAMVSINMTTLERETTFYTGHPGDDLHASVLLNANQLLVSNREELYFFDTETQDYELVSSFPADVHALAFGSHPSGIVSIPQEEIISRNFSVTPTITNSEITIESLFEDHTTSYIIDIVNLSGQHILSEKLAPTASNRIDFSSFAKGTYILTISGNDSKETFQIVRN